MPLTLTANEVRVIGCLMEKSVFTPEQYPLTLNALTNACNQKSGRNPVMSLQPGVVQRTVRDFERHRHVLHRGTETLLVNTLQEAGVIERHTRASGSESTSWGMTWVE